MADRADETLRSLQRLLFLTLGTMNHDRLLLYHDPCAFDGRIPSRHFESEIQCLGRHTGQLSDSEINNFDPRSVFFSGHPGGYLDNAMSDRQFVQEGFFLL